MKYRIAHVGAFDFENYGDLLFTDVLERQLKKRIEIEEIVYFAPKSCTMPNRKEKVYSVVDLEKIVHEKRIDAIVVGGGDLVHLQKIRTYMPHLSEEWVDYEVLYMWVIPCIIAGKYQIPLIWNAPGVPLTFHEGEKKIVSFLCHAVDYISVRDYESQKELGQAIDTTRIKVVPDTVLSIRELIVMEELKQIFQSLNLSLSEKKYIFFQCNATLQEKYFEVCAEALLKMKAETGYEVLLQPIGYALGDEAALEAFKKKYPGEFVLPARHYDQYEILSLIANAAMYIGTSLHGCITSNTYKVPGIVINVNHFNKTDGFVQLIGRENTCIYSPEQLLSAYHTLEDVPEETIENCISEIEDHFDRITEIIVSGQKLQHETYAKEMAEYIFFNGMLENHIPRLDQELQKMQAKYEEQKQKAQFYEAIYHNVMNSTSWKITEPLRKISSRVKRKGD